MGPSNYTMNFCADYLDIDFKQRAKPSFLLNCFQSLSGIHADMIGGGNLRLMEECNAYWVLSRIRIDILRLPGFSEKVNFTTWPLPAQPASCLRCYTAHGADGALMLRAKAMYSILDAQKHTLRSPKSLGAFGPDRYEDEVFDDINLGKVQPAATANCVYKKTARLSDIDINLHVNNAKYADLLFDAFTAEELNERSLTGFQINFISEVREGDTLSVCREDIGGNALVTGYHASGKTAFCAVATLG